MQDNNTPPIRVSEYTCIVNKALVLGDLARCGYIPDLHMYIDCSDQKKDASLADLVLYW